MRHGRAVMPFGKYKGYRLRDVPDQYLSWLSGWEGLDSPQWKWLRDSLCSERRWRGMDDIQGETMKREYRYGEELRETSDGKILEFDRALANAYGTGYAVEAIRISPEHGLEKLGDTYRNKYTQKDIEILLDSEYPKGWFALECCEEYTGTEVPVLVGVNSKKIYLNKKSKGKSAVVIGEFTRRIRVT